MILRVVLLSGLLALGAGAGAASADTLAVLKENTLTLTDAKGGVRTLVIAAGGTLQQALPDGRTGPGVWEARAGDQFCFQPRGEALYCIPMPADKAVGDDWEIRGPTGQLSWTAAIVEGRADLGEK